VRERLLGCRDLGRRGKEEGILYIFNPVRD